MASRMFATVFILLTLGLTLMVFADTDSKNMDHVELEDRVRHLEEIVALRRKRADDFGPLETVVSTQAQKISSLEAQLNAAQAQLTADRTQFNTQLTADRTQFNIQLNALQTQLTNEQNSVGATYVHWGRSQCPSTAQLVYNGVVGAHKYNEQGGGPNRLCLVHTPQFDQAAPLNGQYSVVHGTEWYVPGHDHTEVPCAVCQVPQTKVIMVPGTKTCPSGWTSQYAGHITATSTQSQYTTSSEFVCADENPEDIEGSGAVANDGSFFMYTIAACGSLPCPPYIDGKVLTCVVCSK